MNLPFNIAPEIVTFVASVLPFLELHGALPIGVALGLSPYAALFWSLVANTLVSIIFFRLLDPATKLLMKKSKFIERNLTKFYAKIHKHHSKRFNEISIFLLFIFIAIPTPGTGTYTAFGAAYLFEAPFWPSIVAIMLGNLVRGILLIEGFRLLQLIVHLFH